MAKRDIVVIGASAGGVESLLKLVPQIPPDFPAAIFCILHVGAGHPGPFTKVLAKRAKVPVAEPNDCESVRPGVIYIAPGDYHMTFSDGQIRILSGPKENRHRPSIDTTFRSAARVYGKRVVGVVLTGLMDDGANGLAIIKKHGGVGIVQDPQDAPFPSMPESAIQLDSPDYVAPLSQIPELLVSLCGTDRGGTAIGGNMKSRPENWKPEVENAVGREAPSDFTCPECSGTLFHVHDDGEADSYVCRVGHRYTLNSLISDNYDSVERALWIALRTLEESKAISKKLAERARARGSVNTADMFEERARDRAQQAELIRNLLTLTTNPDPNLEVA